tara:strand:+ start:1715 stop:1984 length:270 start_codon:yes stop_codon:yes gene_type:complete
MLDLIQTSTYKKQLKKYKHNKNVLDELFKIVEILVNEKPIPIKYKNHKLSGNYSNIMELHLKPDDLLLYIKIENKNITLIGIGGHADLF